MEGDARACRLLSLARIDERAQEICLAVRHPNFQFAPKSVEQAIYVDRRSFMLLYIELRVPVFPFLSSYHIPCIMPSNCLESIADAENRNVEFENPTQRILG